MHKLSQSGVKVQTVTATEMKSVFVVLQEENTNQPRVDFQWLESKSNLSLPVRKVRASEEVWSANREHQISIRSTLGTWPQDRQTTEGCTKDNERKFHSGHCHAHL